MRNRNSFNPQYLFVWLSLAVFGAVFFAACDDMVGLYGRLVDREPEGEIEIDEPIPITADIAIRVTDPVIGEEVLDTAAVVDGLLNNFTISDVAWSPDHDTFQNGEIYIVTVTLEADENHAFVLDYIVRITINGNPITPGIEDNGSVATLRHTFDPTDPGGTPGLNFRRLPGGYEVEVFTGDDVDVVIPARYSGLPVTEIGASAFVREGRNLISVDIPSSVTTIRNSAFMFNDLSSVYIPYGVTSIGDNAFNFNNLSSVNIPDSVISIGSWAFNNNNDKLTSVTIGNSVTTIGASAFANNFNLTSVEIGASVQTIEEGAFREGALITVTIPDSVTYIGERAFLRNDLTSVTIGNSVTTIGKEAFAENELSTVIIPNSVTSIEEWAFAWNELTAVTIPSSVDYIGAWAFAENDLTSVTIPFATLEDADARWGRPWRNGIPYDEVTFNWVFAP